jgi:hypothetical protein
MNCSKIQFCSHWGHLLLRYTHITKFFMRVLSKQKCEGKSTSKLQNLRPKRDNFGLNLRPRVFDVWPRCAVVGSQCFQSHEVQHTRIPFPSKSLCDQLRRCCCGGLHVRYHHRHTLVVNAPSSCSKKQTYSRQARPPRRALAPGTRQCSNKSS